MTEAPSMTTPAQRYSADEWVRTLRFEDRTTAVDKAPVHVASRILLNGTTMVRCDLREGFSITGGAVEGTIVSFLVHPDDCQIGRVEGDGTRRDAMIGGLRVLTPKGTRWCTEHTYEPTEAGDGTLLWEWVRVHVYVAEVHIR